MGPRFGGSKVHKRLGRKPKHHQAQVRRKLQASLPKQRVYCLRATRNHGRWHFGN